MPDYCGQGNRDTAFGQLRLLASVLESPPLLIVCDLLRFHVCTKMDQIGLDPVSWTHPEWRIRCPRWQLQTGRVGHGDRSATWNSQVTRP